MIEEIIKENEKIAVIGCSNSEEKSAHAIPKHMKENGYDIIPINPYSEDVLGEKTYDSLLDIPKNLAKKIEIIDVFRPTDESSKYANQVLKFIKKHPDNNLSVIWYQSGIFLDDNELKKKLENKGIKVIENMCIGLEHSKLSGNPLHKN